MFEDSAETGVHKPPTFAQEEAIPTPHCEDFGVTVVEDEALCLRE